MSFDRPRNSEKKIAARITSFFNNIHHEIKGLSYGEAVRKMNEIQSSPAFNKMLNDVIMQMLTMAKRDNAASWRAAAKKGSQGRHIYTLLKSEIDETIIKMALQDMLNENATLFKSVPQRIARNLTKEMMKAYQEGGRAKASQLVVQAKAPWLSSSHAMMIARTELSKAAAALTKARSDNLGVDWYIWQSSHDERVRDSHRFMNNVLVRWNSAPNPEALSGEKSYFGSYHAGCCPNCRCYAEPLLDVSQLNNVVRYFDGGGIKKVGKNKFIDIFLKKGGI